jgi:hypothetical protein
MPVKIERVADVEPVASIPYLARDEKTKVMKSGYTVYRFEGDGPFNVSVEVAAAATNCFRCQRSPDQHEEFTGELTVIEHEKAVTRTETFLACPDRKGKADFRFQVAADSSLKLKFGQPAQPLQPRGGIIEENAVKGGE